MDTCVQNVDFHVATMFRTATYITNSGLLSIHQFADFFNLAHTYYTNRQAIDNIGERRK